MLLYIYGSDSYKRIRRKQFYISEFKRKHPESSVETIDLSEDGGLVRMGEFAGTGSLFDPFRLCVVEVPDFKDKELKEILRLTKDQKEVILLFSQVRKPPSPVSKFFNKPAIIEEFSVPAGPLWDKYIAREAKDMDLNLSLEAVRFMADAYEGDSWRLVTELWKISGLGKKNICLEDLQNLGIEISPEFFSLVGGLGAPHPKDRIVALEKLLSSGEDGAKVFNIFSSLNRGNFQKFANMDIAIKSGKLGYEEALLSIAL